MLDCNDEGGDVFFDSVDYLRRCDSLSSEGSVSGRYSELDYEIWRNEPGSVQERRDRFIKGMGFTEFVPSESSGCRRAGVTHQKLEDEDMSCSGGSLQCPDLVRVTESYGAVSNSLDLYGNWKPEKSDFGRDPDSDMGLLAGELTRCRTNRQARMVNEFHTAIGSSPLAQQLQQREASANYKEEHASKHHHHRKKFCDWWNQILCKKLKKSMMRKSDIKPSSKNCETTKINKMKVQHNKKTCVEFSAVYMGQEIQAHKGFIWTMKFSPDGKYLASGGEDGVVRVWQVTSIDASCKSFSSEGNSEFTHKAKGIKLFPRRINSRAASVVIPQKVFKIEESPLHEFHGHTSDILDLCWSKSNCLLSSSKDKTVRLWQVGFDDCFQVFYHKNYVTCIQFNPVDEGYLISGSIDGKVRIWSIAESRVVNWADVRDIVTAISYQPDGQGFVVGSIGGDCRFYDVSGSRPLLDVQISVRGKKKSSSNRITGFQFSPENSQRIMITSADSKIRIFDGVDVILKYRGLRKSGSQMSASFTSNGRHIISVGEDSRVYVWNYDGLNCASSKQTKSIHSCEHFFFDGVSVAIPWSKMEPEQMGLGRNHLESSLKTPEHLEGGSLLLKDSERFCLNGWFTMDERSKGSATWPEEKLPLWAVPVVEHDNCDLHKCNQNLAHNHSRSHMALSPSWGLVIVTAGRDGVIRTFHNYGLPMRL